MWWCIPVALAILFLFNGVPIILEYKAEKRKRQELEESVKDARRLIDKQMFVEEDEENGK